MNLFGFVPRKEIIRDRNVVPVHEKPHFHDRVGAVVLLRTALPVFWRDGVAVFVNWASVFVQGIQVRTSDVKIVVRTVKVGLGKIPFAYFGRMLEDPFLEFLLVFGDDVKGMVNIIKGKVIKRLKVDILIVQGSPFGARVEHPGKSEQAEDLVSAELCLQAAGLPLDFSVRSFAYCV